ncbi:MAG: GxxExxY protein [Holophaga sp.]|nr:GxxExxY protein [Holophaga sp.]
MTGTERELSIVGLSDYLNELSRVVVDSALLVHRELGPGLLESVYEACLCEELRSRNLRVERQAKLPIHYRGKELDADLRLDLLVEDQLILELKSVDAILPLHKAQLLTYLKLTQRRLGLLINFNVPLIKDGIHRLAN